MPSSVQQTLWQQGRRPGALVVRGAVTLLALAALVDVLAFGRLGVLFDISFVLVCAAAALTVRPQDFFTVGVMPPLLLAAVVLVVALVDRGAVARSDDALLQAVVSGLAHHALALVVGYALTLALLALRQVALRHDGALRKAARTTSAAAPTTAVVPQQATAARASGDSAGSARSPDEAGSEPTGPVTTAGSSERPELTVEP